MPSKTRSNKKSPNRKSRKAPAKRVNRHSTRKAMSVADIRQKFKVMDSSMRDFIKRNNLNNPRELGKQVSRHWAGLFNKHLSGNAAAELGNHYLNLHGKRKAKRGGSLAGAPLDYVMRPGMPAVATYATFPTEVGADPKAVQDLDVYYNSALSRSCGSENTSAHVSHDMGSNLVPAKGGARRRRTMRKRGGDFLTALSVRDFAASNPSGFLQQASEAWMGQGPYKTNSADPSTSAVRLATPGFAPINPDQISIVNKDITQLANPSPYPAVN
jgi:hypothetical protein